VKFDGPVADPDTTKAISPEILAKLQGYGQTYRDPTTGLVYNSVWDNNNSKLAAVNVTTALDAAPGLKNYQYGGDGTFRAAIDWMPPAVKDNWDSAPAKALLAKALAAQQAGIPFVPPPGPATASQPILPAFPNPAAPTATPSPQPPMQQQPVVAPPPQAAQAPQGMVPATAVRQQLVQALSRNNNSQGNRQVPQSVVSRILSDRGPMDVAPTRGRNSTQDSIVATLLQRMGLR
jgi:hypothetical protein